MNPVMRLYEKFVDGLVRRQFGPVLIVLAMCVGPVFNKWVALAVAIFSVLLMICFMVSKKKKMMERWGVFPRHGTMIPGFSSQQEADQYIADHKMEEGAIAHQISVDGSCYLENYDRWFHRWRKV